jgi:hypothetical protein
MPRAYQKKNLNREYDEHVKRVIDMKSLVDSGPPRTAKVESGKKEIERRRRYESIELDNRLMLERLAKIMQKKTIDNENKAAKFGKSLMQTHRKLELQRITQENQRLLRRIQETEPCYNHLAWEDDAKKRSIYMKNMSEYQEVKPLPECRIPHPQRRNKSATQRTTLRPLSGAHLRPISAPRSRNAEVDEMF